MEDAKFPHKFGAGWTAAADAPVYNHDFEGLDEMHAHVDGPNIRFEERAQAGVDQNYTYHVDRGKFDMLLLQHASQLGADVYEGVRVSGAEFNGAATVNYKVAGREAKTTCKIVVDASGRRTLLGNQLKLRIRDKVFDQFAIHTWFENYDRKSWNKKESMQDFIFIHFLPVSNS